MVQALLHRVAADMTCEAENIWHRFRIWSICCWATGCAGAVVILAVIGTDPTWRLIGLMCTAAAQAVSRVHAVAARVRHCDGGLRHRSPKP